MLSVQTGASRAIDECKFQFRTRRWNCSTLDDTAAAKWDADGLPRRSEVPTTVVSLPSTSRTSKRKNAKGDAATPLAISTIRLTADFISEPRLVREHDAKRRVLPREPADRREEGVPARTDAHRARR